jgi:hypothetical protein
VPRRHGRVDRRQQCWESPGRSGAQRTGGLLRALGQYGLYSQLSAYAHFAAAFAAPSPIWVHLGPNLQTTALRPLPPPCGATRSPHVRRRLGGEPSGCVMCFASPDW